MKFGIWILVMDSVADSFVDLGSTLTPWRGVEKASAEVIVKSVLSRGTF